VHWLDGPPDASCKDSKDQYAVDDSWPFCKQQVEVRVFSFSIRRSRSRRRRARPASLRRSAARLPGGRGSDAVGRNAARNWVTPAQRGGRSWAAQFMRLRRHSHLHQILLRHSPLCNYGEEEAVTCPSASRAASSAGVATRPGSRAGRRRRPC
jgi:hypothetical protein